MQRQIQLRLTNLHGLGEQCFLQASKKLQQFKELWFKENRTLAQPVGKLFKWVVDIICGLTFRKRATWTDPQIAKGTGP